MNTDLAAVGSLTAEQVETVLTAAAAAPSLHNSQPWRFRTAPGAIELHADTGREISVADPDHRELVLACGAALLNLRLAIRALGVNVSVSLLPHPGEPNFLVR